MPSGNPMQLLLQMMSSGNPQQFMQNMMRQNPQMNAMFNQQKQSGLSMEQYVKQFAKQNNIDLQPLINAMRQRGYKF